MMLKDAVKSGIATVRRPVAALRLRRVIRRTAAPYKVNVGCGGTRLAGWINTDVGWRAPLWLDVGQRWPFPPGSVSHVYGDNMVEHIRIGVARVFFREAFQALVAGGRIRLITPDVGMLVKLYSEEGEEARWHLRNAREHGYEANHAVDLLRIVFQDAGHYLGQLWDFAALRDELTAAGFAGVVRCRNGESEDAVLRGLEQRAVREESPITLAVEAVKP